MTHSITPEKSELGKKAEYDAQYNPDKLFPIPREENRSKIDIGKKLPFFGFDIWNHYEVSWLNEKGKPVVALAEIIFECDSTYLIESKSMKLYFNSFNNTKIKNEKVLENMIKKDLEERTNSSVIVSVTPLSEVTDTILFRGFEGACIDDLDIECTDYRLNPSHLKTHNEVVEESLYSDLLKSNCLVTNQPDWASVQISYKGKKINHEGLLRYIVSFRNCNEFSEQCIERIFMDIMKYCQPTELTIVGRYTRRGGLDINAVRSTKKIESIDNVRFCRQ